MTLLLSVASFILMPWCSELPSVIFKATGTLGPWFRELDATVLINHMRTEEIKG